jgi:hypothetical protein
MAITWNFLGLLLPEAFPMVCPCGLVSGAGAPMQLLADQLEFALLSSPGGYGSKKNEKIYIYIYIYVLFFYAPRWRQPEMKA